MKPATNPADRLTAQELKALVSLLEDEDQEVLGHVKRKILSLGDQIIPFLEEEWERVGNPLLQKRLEGIITHLQQDILTDRLRTWLAGEQQDLLEGLWILATYQYPELRYAQLKEQIEEIYYQCWLSFKAEARPFDQVKSLNQVFFDKLRFRANTKKFHAADNSFINRVLENRKGNPISLCAIYLLVAQKLKMPVYGVNLPNLFVLTYKQADTQFYINAFNKGLIFSKADIDNYISQLDIGQQDSFYQPCSHQTILKRMLFNLVVAYDKAEDQQKVADIKFLLELFQKH